MQLQIPERQDKSLDTIPESKHNTVKQSLPVTEQNSQENITLEAAVMDVNKEHQNHN